MATALAVIGGTIVGLIGVVFVGWVLFKIDGGE